MWELDNKKGWVLKNWYLWTVVLETTPESPLDGKEIQPVSLKGNQPWIQKFFLKSNNIRAHTAGFVNPFIGPPINCIHMHTYWCGWFIFTSLQSYSLCGSATCFFFFSCDIFFDSFLQSTHGIVVFYSKETFLNQRWYHPTTLPSVQFSHSVVSDSLRPHALQHARPPCPSPTPRVYPNSCPLSQWCHPTIILCRPCLLLTSVFPASGSFQMSQSHQVAKVLEFQLQHQSFQWTPRTDLL